MREPLGWFWLGQGVLDVVVGQVEVAAAMQHGRAAERGLELRDPLFDQFGPERIVKIRVRRGDDIGGAGRRRHPQHFEAFVERLRPIVHPIEDVAVNVDQINISSSDVA